MDKERTTYYFTTKVKDFKGVEVPYTLSDTSLPRLMKDVAERIANAALDSDAAISWGDGQAILLRREKI